MFTSFLSKMNFSIIINYLKINLTIYIYIYIYILLIQNNNIVYNTIININGESEF